MNWDMIFGFILGLFVGFLLMGYGWNNARDLWFNEGYKKGINERRIT